MRTFSRFIVTVTLAAGAMAGPAAHDVPSARAAQLSADAAGSGFTASGPSKCNPQELMAKSNIHLYKAVDYQNRLMAELLKEKPDQEKVARYHEKEQEHRRKSDEYRAKAQACRDAEKEA